MARFLFHALAFALALTGSAIAQQPDLTGRWSANDGGTYCIRQLGNELWWYGQGSDGGNNWSNVLHATLQGNRAVGRWADVPHGGIHGAGEMELQVVSPNRLVATRKTGGFGGTEWTRQGAPAASAPAAPAGGTDMLTIPNDRPVKGTSNIVLQRGRWDGLEATGVITHWT